ncbi:hypothetical protein C8R43DRAFT_1127313 [Mycena crocata]|nr:hypothetical protein C8R43DRAFT_1127313 [Mycena crocata]
MFRHDRKKRAFSLETWIPNRFPFGKDARVTSANATAGRRSLLSSLVLSGNCRQLPTIVFLFCLSLFNVSRWHADVGPPLFVVVAVDSTATTFVAPPAPTSSSASATATQQAAIDVPRPVPAWGIVLVSLAGVLIFAILTYLVILPCCRRRRQPVQSPPHYEDHHLDVVVDIGPIIDIGPSAPSSSSSAANQTLDSPSGDAWSLKTHSSCDPCDPNATRRETTRSRAALPNIVVFPISRSDSDSSDSDSWSEYHYPTAAPAPTPTPSDSNMPRDAAVELDFPVPGSYNAETKTYQIEKKLVYADIGYVLLNPQLMSVLYCRKGPHATVAHLRELFVRYHQPPGSLRKDKLQAWLEEFSKHPENWPSQLEPGARNSHRNPRHGTKRANVKASTIRRQAMMAGTSAPGTVPSRAPTDRSIDQRPAQEIADLLPWAAAMDRKYPYKPKKERNAQLGPPTHTQKKIPISMQEHFQKTEAHMLSTTAALQHIVASLGESSSVGHPRPTSTMPELAHDPFATTAYCGGSTSSSSLEHLSSFSSGNCSPRSISVAPRAVSVSPGPCSAVTPSVTSSSTSCSSTFTSSSNSEHLGSFTNGNGSPRSISVAPRAAPLGANLVIANLDVSMPPRPLHTNTRLVSQGPCSAVTPSVESSSTYSSAASSVAPYARSTSSSTGSFSAPLTRGTPLPLTVPVAPETVYKLLDIYLPLESSVALSNTHPDGLFYQQGAPQAATRLVFTSADIPNPTSLKFSGDGRAQMEELIVMWSDQPGTPWHTHPSAAAFRKRMPHIQGNAIAIEHWPRVYKKLAGKHKFMWEKNKHRWSDWKFIMDLWEHTPNDTAFWNHFPPQPNGDISSVSQIGGTLRSLRTVRDAQDEQKAYTEYGAPTSERFQANFRIKGSSGCLSRPDAVAGRYRDLIASRAKAEYADRFEDIFVYHGRRGRTVMTQPADIAEKYQELQG